MADLGAIAHNYALGVPSSIFAIGSTGRTGELQNSYEGKIAGVVLEGATPVPQAKVGVFYRRDMHLIRTTRTNQYGVFVFTQLEEALGDNYFVVALDPDGGTQYNAIVFDRLSPVTSLTRLVNSVGGDNSLFGTGEIGFTSYDGYVVSLAPLAYWRLEETSGPTLADEMGFAPMTAINGTYTYGRPSGLFMQGETSIGHIARSTNEHMTTGRITGLVPGATGFSLLLLAKLSTEGYYQTMLAWRDYTAGGADHTFSLFTRNSGMGREVGSKSWSAATASTTVCVDGFTDDRWHMFCITYDAATNTKRLYVDGALKDARVQGAPPVWPSSASVTLFNDADGAFASSSRCELDEVAVFNYPLTETQVIRAAILWGNKARLNPDDRHASIVLSNNDLTATTIDNGWSSVRTTHGKSSGRWYWEAVVEDDAAQGTVLGVSVPLMSLTSYPGQYAGTAGLWARVGAQPIAYVDNANSTLSTATIAVGDTIGFVIDIEAKTIDFYINGVRVFGRIGISGNAYPTLSCKGGGRASVRLTQDMFTQAVPGDAAPFGGVTYTPPVAVGWDPLAKGALWYISRASYLASCDAIYSWQTVRAVTTRNSGKRYFEVTMPSITHAGGMAVGVQDAAHPLTLIGVAGGGFGYISDARRYNGGTASSYGVTYGANDTIGVLVDFTAQTIEFVKNGVPLGVAYTGAVSGDLYPAVSCYVGYGAVSLNTGRVPFVYAVPVDVVAWDS